MLNTYVRTVNWGKLGAKVASHGGATKELRARDESETQQRNLRINTCDTDPVKPHR